MSFRVRDIHAIHTNPLNQSISKQLYTIPKAERFKRSKTEMADKYYDFPSTISMKGVPFMSAQRKNILTCNAQNPPPNCYNIQQTKIEVKDITLALGRKECKNNGFLNNLSKNPGPGSYSPNPQMIQKTCSKFSFRQQKRSDSKMEADKHPGPGTYHLKSTILEKNKILSTEKKQRYPVIKDSSIKGIFDITQKSNAPLYYPKYDKKGNQSLLKTGGFSIGKSQRFSYNNQNKVTKSPGPGSYKQFSEFTQFS